MYVRRQSKRDWTLSYINLNLNSMKQHCELLEAYEDGQRHTFTSENTALVKPNASFHSFVDGVKRS